MNSIEKQAFIDAAKEVETDKTDSGTWIKAMALARGDEGLAKHEYIRLRAEELAEVRRDTSSPCETKGKTLHQLYIENEGLLIDLLLIVTCAVGITPLFTSMHHYLMGTLLCVGSLLLGGRFLYFNDRARFVTCVLVSLYIAFSLFFGGENSQPFLTGSFVSSIFLLLLHVKQDHFHLLRLLLIAVALYFTSLAIFFIGEDFKDDLKTDYTSRDKSELKRFFTTSTQPGVVYRLPTDLRKEFLQAKPENQGLLSLELSERVVSRWIAQQQDGLTETDVHENYEWYTIKNFGTTGSLEINRKIAEHYKEQDRNALEEFNNDRGWKKQLLTYYALGLAGVGVVLAVLLGILKKWFFPKYKSFLTDDNLYLPEHMRNLFWISLISTIVLLLAGFLEHENLIYRAVLRTTFGICTAIAMFALVFGTIRAIQAIFLRKTTYLDVFLRSFVGVGVYAIFVALLLATQTFDDILPRAASSNMDKSSSGTSQYQTHQDVVIKGVTHYLDKIYEEMVDPWDDLEIEFLWSAPPGTGELNAAIEQVQRLKTTLTGLSDVEYIEKAEALIDLSSLSRQEKRFLHEMVETVTSHLKESGRIDLESIAYIETMLYLLRDAQWSSSGGIYSFSNPQESEQFNAASVSLLDAVKRIEELRKASRESLDQSYQNLAEGSN